MLKYKVMKYKIGVFGSAAGEYEEMMPKARELGEELAKYKDKIVVVTGAADGLPYETAYIASQKGVEIWGYAPTISKKDLKVISPKQNLSIYKKLVYVPSTFPYIDDLMVCRKYRNVISTANCDAGIIVSGRWGTIHEFSSLYDYGKVIGVYTGTGSFAGEVSYLMKKVSKKSKAVILYNDSPKLLVNNIIKELNSR